MPVIADKLFNVSVNSCWPLSLLTHNSSIKSGFVVQRQGPAASLNTVVFSRCDGRALHLKSSAKGSRGHVHVRTCLKGKSGISDSMFRSLPLRSVQSDHTFDDLRLSCCCF